jgi:hypothetical protein
MGGTVNWNDGGVLETSVRAGERGPLIVLSGAAEFTNITQLIEVINSQTMKMHGGSMVLIRPQPAVVSVLTLVDEEQVIAVRAGSP